MAGLITLIVSVFLGQCQSTGWTDPSNDQLSGAGAPLLDLVGVSTDFTSPGFQVMLTYSPAHTSAELETHSAFVDIDSDNSASTGIPTAIEAFGLDEPYPEMGVDYTIEVILALGSGEAYLYGIVDYNLELIGSYPVDLVGNTVVFSVPFAHGGHPGIVVEAGHRVSVLVSNEMAEFTDRAPNGSVALTATAVPADFDTDGDVDVDDLSQLISCSTGPAVPQTLQACAAADLDDDDDVDQDDFGILQRAYTGPCVP